MYMNPEKLFTTSILSKKSPDRTTISVMSRHTENDGVTPKKEIQEGISFDEWMRHFAPPSKLVGGYYRVEISWEEFEVAYRRFLESDALKIQLEEFAERCLKEPITLVCIEADADRCHRRLLAEKLKELQPKLEIVHM